MQNNDINKENQYPKTVKFLNFAIKLVRKIEPAAERRDRSFLPKAGYSERV